MIPLSGATVNHLIRLPHLLTCHIDGPPPSYSPRPSLLVFPPLVEFALGGGTTHGWLSLFEPLEGRVTPSFNVKESLKTLKLPVPTIAPFASLNQTFRNFADLNVDLRCYGKDDKGRCVLELYVQRQRRRARYGAVSAGAFLLGSPCSNKTRITIVACRLPISVHCIGLQALEIRFNTATVVDDPRKLSGGPRCREPRSRLRFTLSRLDVYQMPLTLDEPGFETVVAGMADIFPSLECYLGVVRPSGL